MAEDLTNQQMIDIGLIPRGDDYGRADIREDRFGDTAAWAAKDAWESAKQNFANRGTKEGVAGSLPDADSAILNKFTQGIGYAADMGLAGLEASDAAWRYSVGLASELIPGLNNNQERRFTRDVSSIPDAFVGSPTALGSGAGVPTALEARLGSQIAGERVLDAMPTDAYDPNQMNMFGTRGTSGRGVDPDRLSYAVEMKRQGIDDGIIWEDTGLEWNPTLKDWEFEIDSSGLKMDDDAVRMIFTNEDGAVAGPRKGYEPTEQDAFARMYRDVDEALADSPGDLIEVGESLGQIFDFEPLYQEYPFLKDAKLVLRDGFGASYDGENNIVTMGLETMRDTNSMAIDPENFKSILVHELQHGIQSVNSMAPGGSNNRWIMQNDPEVLALAQSGDVEAARALAFNKYRADQGEVQARASQMRREMTEGERRETPPSATYRMALVEQMRKYQVAPGQNMPTAKNLHQAPRDMVDPGDVYPGGDEEYFQQFAEGGLDSNLLPASADVGQSNLDAWSEGAYFKDPVTGQPQQMYHGMGGTLRGEPIEFMGDNLEPSYAGTLGPGTYITDDPSVASDFATGKRGAGYTDEKFGGQVFPVYTNVTNVVDDAVINSNRELREELADRIVDIADENADQYLYDLVDKLKADGDIELGSLYTRLEDGKVRSSGVGSLVSEVFETNGYDAVSVVTDKGFHEAVIFQGHGGLEYPNQNIKSTLQGPDGAYSRETNDMRFAEGGLVAEVSNNAMADYFKAASGMMSEEEFTGKHKMSTRAFENKFEEQNNVDISGAESFTEITGTSKGDNMRKQMSFFNEGGMAAPRRDPVSGNEIPLGSSAENVRDDVPAMLSEGEYIVPADVVRFFGVNFFEQLRDKAKGDMQEMVADDRVGGQQAPQQSVDPEMVQAVTQMAEGGLIDSGNINQLIDKVVESAKTNPELQGIFQKRGIMMAEGGLVTGDQPQGTFNAADWQNVGGSYGVGNAGGNGADGGFEYVPYTGPNGNTMMVLHINGAPAQTIPEGYSSGKASAGINPNAGSGSYTAPTAPTPQGNDKDQSMNAAQLYAQQGPGGQGVSMGEAGGSLANFNSPLDGLDFTDSESVVEHFSGRLAPDALKAKLSPNLGLSMASGAVNMGREARRIAETRAAAMAADAAGNEELATNLREMAQTAHDEYGLGGIMGLIPDEMMDGDRIYEGYVQKQQRLAEDGEIAGRSAVTGTSANTNDMQAVSRDTPAGARPISGGVASASPLVRNNDGDGHRTVTDVGGVTYNQTSNSDDPNTYSSRTAVGSTAPTTSSRPGPGRPNMYKGGLVTRPKK